MRPEVMERIRQLIGQRRKIEAIKLYREKTRVGLKEAKDAVEAMERGEPVAGLVVDDGAPESPPGRLTPATLQKVKQLVAAGKHIDAIKELRAATDFSLKEAKEAVEALRAGRTPPQLSVFVRGPGLPARCSSCGAAIGEASIRWVTPELAECRYCGTYLRDS
jgi:ribosomal protein L7/L12